MDGVMTLEQAGSKETGFIFGRKAKPHLSMTRNGVLIYSMAPS
jgi:hypothetical protein